ncbi:myb/SANT-like DNA-binding domain-containing protein 2 isoform X2 [Ambystoma mexicanum]|uniref:myb/SANT-like DNA-binding domain-containing protein 2 isoform X2 n=1 Tax=Ambystoma mexicanum TaxID=8296 RepID=UPI0037E8E55D
MAAPCESALSSEQAPPPPLKIPKHEAMSPASPGLSDGHPSLSAPSTPSHSSPLEGGAGGPGLASSPSVSFSTAAACRGMSWTPAETNALIAVWGNERLVEAHYQQLEGAGTLFASKAPGPAMYERVSRALLELGYERTPSQCRERMKTLRRCYSRVKEHGVGKRKSSYTFEQLEQVFGQGGWDSKPLTPVLINSSGLYQEVESDSSTMEDFSQDDWGNHSHDLQGFQAGDPDVAAAVGSSTRLALSSDPSGEGGRKEREEGEGNDGVGNDGEEVEISAAPKKPMNIRPESSEELQKRELYQNTMNILESVHLKWELFQSWTDFSRLHLSNKLAIFGIGFNTRWKEDIRYHYAEISSQVPLGKRLREYFNPEKPEGRIIMTRVQKMNWKNVYYKFLEITISEARCLELHMEFCWIPIAHSKPIGGNIVQYLLPGGIPKSPGLYAIGYQDIYDKPTPTPPENDVQDLTNESKGADSENLSAQTPKRPSLSSKITYCYLGIAEGRTLQQCLFLHFQSTVKCHSKEWAGINGFLAQNCVVEPGVSPKTMYIKFVEVERDFLSAGSLVECLEKAIGYPLKFNN